MQIRHRIFPTDKQNHHGKKWMGIFLSLLMVISVLTPGTEMAALAAGSAVDAKITKLELQTIAGQPATEVDKSATVKMKFNFETPASVLHEGDYFDITIPKEMDLTTAATNPLTFDVTDENGDVVAKATISPTATSTSNGGGNVRVTFTKKANGKYSFKGNLFFDTKLNKKIVKDNETIHVKTKVNNREDITPDPVPLKVKPDAALSKKEIIGKWGKSATSATVAAWGVRVNRTKQNLKNVVITDKITSNNGHFLDPSPMPAVKTTEQFKLLKVDYDAAGNVISYDGEVVDISDKVTFNADKTEFTLNLGDIGTQSYFLSYKSTVENGDIVQTNSAKITSDTFETQTSGGVWKYRSSGGGAVGVLAKRLKIRKIDVDDGTGLAGAKFRVTKSDGSTFELVTGADGTIVSQELVQGKYKVKEILAPAGYDIDPNEYTVQVYNDVGGTITVKDKAERTSVKVTKKWIGKEGASATVHLYADNTDTGKTATLDAGNSWSYTFENLKQKKADGSAIKYTVKEDAIAGYDSAVSGNETAGYTVTNTNIEKISIPVEKKWVGPEGASAMVKLTADGAVKDTVTLTKAGNNWKHTFANLPRYDANDGHEIAYNVEEVPVAGYKTVVSGAVQTGFTITNTIEGKVSVPVTKTWVGKKGDSARIHLLADGVEKDAVTLNESNHWQHTFADLDKYNSGVEIQYTVTEDPLAGYDSAVSGNMAAGFTVTNTNTEKISIPVEKKWVGPEGASATVKLTADGVVKDTVTLTKAGNHWKHTFANLPRYDANDGHEIDYKVEETPVTGYTTAISGTAQTGFTITNTVEGKVSVPVTKTWVGKKGNSARIHLYADGVEKDAVTLNESNHWQHTFSNLDKYKSGIEIQYTVKEDPIVGYDSAVSGNMTTGFTFTNTNTEKISIPIEKKWVGPEGASATVKLLADGNLKETVTLSRASSWKHTFANLPKYDTGDGHEIAYTLDEVKVDGYSTGISGNAANGFTVTNTITGKVSVPVTKQWIGNPTEQVTVNLYADGQKVDSKKLSKGNHWQYTFKDLDQYKDGKEIKYTVEEEAVAGYTSSISGDAASGFTITNIQNQPKPKTPDQPNTPSKAPKTGDLGNLPLYGAGLLLAVVAVLILIARRRRQTK